MVLMAIYCRLRDLTPKSSENSQARATTEKEAASEPYHRTFTIPAHVHRGGPYVGH